MPIFTVCILFDVSERIWKVCRAHTVIEKHATRHDAICGACAIAVSLRRHMYCDMSFRLRDRYGGWHTYTFVDDDRPASAIASSLLRKCRDFDVMIFIRSLSAWRACIRTFLEWNMSLLPRRMVKSHFGS
ncbi:MAG TPA: hypothetical protein VFK31_11660 [Rhodanobacteraceae bacterium]|nr:hypothetical protein [Rhodanobacteraceae bacterium]